MIRQSDLWVNYIPFKLISILSILPINLNLKTRKIEIFQAGWHYWVWLLWFINSACYGFYKVIRLVQSLTFGDYAQFNHLAMHISLSSFSTDMFIWSCMLFTQNQPINAVIFNQLLYDKSNKSKRGQYKVQEWFMLLLPVTFYRCAFGIINMYTIDPSSHEFYYSALPAQFQNEFVLAGCIFYEGCMVVYWVCVCYYGTFVQIFFIQNCNDQLEANTKKIVGQNSLAGGFGKMKRECHRLRVMELSIKFFNQVHRYCIFSDKQNLILQGTTYWFYFVRFSYNVDLRYQYGYNAIYLPLIFLITYDKGFSIPTKMDRLKNQLLVTSQGLRFKYCRDYTNKFIKSVPNSGIQVGGFNVLERISTPTFVNFIIEQATSLLIAFPSS